MTPQVDINIACVLVGFTWISAGVGLIELIFSQNPATTFLAFVLSSVGLGLGLKLILTQIILL